MESVEHWWVEDLQTIFAQQPRHKLEQNLASVSTIATLLRSDAPWNRDAAGKAAYRTARYWLGSGKWDQVLVALHLNGETRLWPASSARWGSEPFNRFGYPQAGFFTIASLRQARIYNQQGGPCPANPYPLRKLHQQSSNWRTATGIGNTTALENSLHPKPEARISSL